MKHLVAIIVVLAAIPSAQAQPRHNPQHPMPGTVGVTPAPLNCVLGTFPGFSRSTAPTAPSMAQHKVFEDQLAFATSERILTPGKDDHGELDAQTRNYAFRN